MRTTTLTDMKSREFCSYLYTWSRPGTRIHHCRVSFLCSSLRCTRRRSRTYITSDIPNWPLTISQTLTSLKCHPNAPATATLRCIAAVITAVDARSVPCQYRGHITPINSRGVASCMHVLGDIFAAVIGTVITVSYRVNDGINACTYLDITWHILYDVHCRGHDCCVALDYGMDFAPLQYHH